MTSDVSKAGISLLSPEPCRAFKYTK